MCVYREPDKTETLHCADGRDSSSFPPEFDMRTRTTKGGKGIKHSVHFSNSFMLGEKKKNTKNNLLKRDHESSKNF